MPQVYADDAYLLALFPQFLTPGAPPQGLVLGAIVAFVVHKVFTIGAH